LEVSALGMPMMGHCMTGRGMMERMVTLMYHSRYTDILISMTPSKVKCEHERKSCAARVQNSYCKCLDQKRVA
jgi:hypothetical protein